ncbi:uncharacterized protein VP01_638g5, partial [Puccinia sorghi]
MPAHLCRHHPTEGDEDKLAVMGVICCAGQFTPLTMPFGPTSAPGYFQYFMQD